jgi:hypothetical protein
MKRMDRSRQLLERAKKLTLDNSKTQRFEEEIEDRAGAASQ